MSELQDVDDKVQVSNLASVESWRDLFRSPSFVIGFFGLLPLVYIILLSLVGIIGTATWSDDVRASIAGLIVGTVIGGLVGYYYGQTTSRNRMTST